MEHEDDNQAISFKHEDDNQAILFSYEDDNQAILFTFMLLWRRQSSNIIYISVVMKTTIKQSYLHFCCYEDDNQAI